MKILCCVASLEQLSSFFDHFGISYKPENSGNIFSSPLLNHEIDFLETTEVSIAATTRLTKTLLNNKYHLALFFTIGTGYKAEFTPGTILNVINEKPGDLGTFDNGQWTDVYDSGLLSRENPPHTRGGFINLTNSYMNVFSPYKKTVGITVSTYADEMRWKGKQEAYKADCETRTGLAFAYVCLSERQTYYHLCSIDKNLATGESNEKKALESLNNCAIDIVSKL